MNNLLERLALLATWLGRVPLPPPESPSGCSPPLSPSGIKPPLPPAIDGKPPIGIKNGGIGFEGVFGRLRALQIPALTSSGLGLR